MKEKASGYRCIICGTVYQNKIFAEHCELSHDIIFVKFKREDLFKLIQFLYTGDRSLISKELMKTLQKYAKGNYL